MSLSKARLNCDVSSIVSPGPPKARVSRGTGVPQIRCDHPTRKLAFLVHPDGAVHAIIDQHDDNRQPIVNGSRKLLTMHEKMSVASKADDDALRKNTRRSYCRRQAKTHRAEGGPDLLLNLTEAQKSRPIWRGCRHRS